MAEVTKNFSRCISNLFGFSSLLPLTPLGKTKKHYSSKTRKDILKKRSYTIVRFRAPTSMAYPTPTDGVADATPHFVLVPMMAQGHSIPMSDIAVLLARRGVHVSFITTPLNASRIKPIIDRVKENNLPIEFVSLHFPCEEVGLPRGCENVDALPSREHSKSFLQACYMLKDPLTFHLRGHHLPPSCIISDAMHSWTGHIARDFAIPRLSFMGFGGFSTLCRHVILQHKLYEGDDEDTVVLPDFPHRLEILKMQIPGPLFGSGLDKFRSEMIEEEFRADGIVMNTFHELEALYIEFDEKAIKKKVWTIGPMFLSNRDVVDTAARGNKASVDEKLCLQWLDSMKPRSVMYVSFGSLAHTNPGQLIEIGMGLEASNCPFIWVIKAKDKWPEVEAWLSEGFEERTRLRGLIIRGWAPQLMILSHPAVGGFMTHCGWNSTLEGISAGVPMITWPHFAEQFLNEKLIVEVLQIGVSIGVKVLTNWGVENNDLQVRRGDVEKAVSILMEEGDEGKARRGRSRELAEKASKAIQEGGSSYENIELLIQQTKANMLS